MTSQIQMMTKNSRCLVWMANQREERTRDSERRKLSPVAIINEAGVDVCTKCVVQITPPPTRKAFDDTQWETDLSLRQIAEAAVNQMI